MTSIVERLKTSEERDSDALVAGLEIRTQAFIDGAYVDALSGRDVRLRQPGHGADDRVDRLVRLPPTSIAPSRARGARSTRAAGRARRRSSASGSCAAWRR